MNPYNQGRDIKFSESGDQFIIIIIIIITIFFIINNIPFIISKLLL